MSDQQFEKLSALMDGELSDRLAGNLLDQSGQDPEFGSAWERYHLIGQAMRGEAYNPTARQVSESVGETLLTEPIPIRRRASRNTPHARLAPFGGAALAAAAAFLAVFAVPNLFQGPETEPATSPGQPLTTWTPVGAAAERRWDLDRPDLASKLDLFLVSHQEAAPATGVKGILPYATLVGYEAAR
jgi:sigma-E factor negative regulatory protein RseA